MKEQTTDKKTAILDAAERLFAQNGYDSTSTREIAEQVGVNVAMIAYYFGSKENLLKAIIERYGRAAVSLFRSKYDTALPPDERLRRITSSYLDHALAHPNPIVIAQREMGIAIRPDMHECMVEIFQEIQSMIEACVNEGREAGIFRQVDVRLFVFIVGGLYDHMVNQVHVMQNLQIDGSIFGLPVTDTDSAREKIEHVLWDLTESYLKKR